MRDLSSIFKGQSELRQRELTSNTRHKAKEIWVIPQEKNRRQLTSLSVLCTVGNLVQPLPLLPKTGNCR